MRVSELARRTGTTIRALRYYESLGLVVPTRGDNGYRDYPPIAVELVGQIRELTALGLRVEETRPFVECLCDGHDQGDACPAALATYRRAVLDLDDRIAGLAAQRDSLRARLDAAAGRVLDAAAGRVLDAAAEPATTRTAASARVASRTAASRAGSVGAASRAGADRPAATDPGRDPAALVGGRVGVLALAATDGRTVDLGAGGDGRSVVFVYPLSGRPGVDLPDGFTEIPGARGCTDQACGFRDRHRELLTAGADCVFGLSAQSTGYQRELAYRLRLPYPLLADPGLAAARVLGLPTFTVGGMTLYRRLTLIVVDGVVEHVFTRIPEPAGHAEQVVGWLRERISHEPCSGR
ncbi:hypothetical protein GCM10023322_42870 [Rugosimonospora acidiphila]|uniref:HTH merR-type domain-containing protein n=1 Tax=Rugosimonospora acidiphila TaxID=556531 RepID=A0ABP9S1E9_9ACTN